MNQKIQPAITLPSSLLIDPSKEPLGVILKPYAGITHVPTDLAADNGPDCMVFIELQKCFAKAGFVAEGMINNIIWGFTECGFDPRHVAAGLAGLRAKGYVLYTDEGKMPIHEFSFDPKKPVWIRYTSKFTNLLIKKIQV